MAMLDAVVTNAHAIAVMLLIVIAFVMYTRENIAFETTSLFVLATLVIGFQLFPFVQQDGSLLQPADFLLGFGHKALVAVCGLMIVGEGLIRSGALEPVGRFLARLWRKWPRVSLLVTILTTVALSMFINDTPVVLLMMPILVGVALRTGAPPSGFLIPMGFAAILGGMATTIGTSTNLLVVTVAADMGMAPFYMFDFVQIVGIAAIPAVLYLWLVAPRLLPPREAPMTGQLAARIYTAQVRLDETSPVVGMRMAEAIERVGEKFQLESIQRGRGVHISPLPDVVLRAGDRITTSDTQVRLREIARLLGGTLFSGDHAVDADHPLKSEGKVIAEVAITPASSLVGRAIGDARLRHQYGLRLLALHRYQVQQESRTPGLEEIELQAGDVLLVQSSQESLDAIKRTADFLVLDGGVKLPSTRKAPLALAIMVAVVALAAFRVVPIEASVLLGCLALIVTGCLSWKDAMNALSTRVILIIVASLGMGAALMKTGGSDIIAGAFVSLTFGAPPWLVLAGVMLMMGILTNIVSNNAAAVIGTPIAIGIAQSMGLPLEPFVLAVLFSANLSFVTPMGYQTNLLIMNAAGYRFADFVRVGLPLAALLWISLTTVLVISYSL
jgi:di/tricarboxylate transporter